MKTSEILDLLAEENKAHDIEYSNNGSCVIKHKVRTPQTKALVMAYQEMCLMRNFILSVKFAIDDVYPELAPKPMLQLRNNLERFIT